MSTYRKPTEKEMKKIYLFLKGKYDSGDEIDNDEFRKFAKRFYPANAASMLISLSSDYNDETYSYGISFVVVYDKDENELSPIKGKSVEAREEALNLPNPYDDEECYEERETEFVISLSGDADFDLYVKDKE